MPSDFPAQISRFKPSLALSTSKLIKEVISPLNYYNEQARGEEMTKYGKAKLLAMYAADKDSILLVSVGGKLAGFCVSEYDDGIIWLSWFGVADRWRGRGAGTLLLRALEETVRRRKCHKIWCDTRTSNTKSQKALRKVGYSRIAKLTRHWYGQDFYLWEKFVD